MKKKNLVLLLSFFILIAFVVLPLSVKADDASILRDKISDLEQKITDSRNQQKTLSSQINLMNQKISLIQLQISQTKNQINALEKEIESLSGKIEKLDVSLDKVSQILLRRIVETYKRGQLEPSLFLFSSQNAGQFLRNYKYIQEAQKHDKMLMLALEEAKQNFDAQKSLKEEKQEKLEDLRAQLERQNVLLANEKQAKENLLEVTRGDEKRYQNLLAQAKRELYALRAFTSSRVGAGGPDLREWPNGETGWFYSQQDSRWGENLIGLSDMKVWEVGCLITSVAMIYKSNGVDVTPATIASDPNYFFSDTAYMLLPFPSLSGFHFTAISTDDVGNQLQQNNPVIVHVSTGTYDGHWIVLIKRDGDDYIINDPWEGPDKKLSEYYSWSQVSRPYYLQK